MAETVKLSDKEGATEPRGRCQQATCNKHMKILSFSEWQTPTQNLSRFHQKSEEIMRSLVHFPVARTGGDEGSRSRRRSPAPLRIGSVAQITDYASLLEFRVFGFGLKQDGHIRVRVFPQSEEILISSAGFRSIAREGVATCQPNVRERVEGTDGA